jgi:hypothetical protein
MKKFILNHPIEILFSTLFLTLAAILNLQFLEGSNVNFTFSGHDEYLTVREVYSILQPLSLKHFIMAIISGDVLYYGRIVFYVDALLAFIPYKIWGIDGMVYAIRMTHVIELLLGILLLNNFIKTNVGKLFFAFNVLILYYTAYFVMVPKPEPLQLLLLAIFLIKAHKVNWQFGWHFIWLGMAYGVKFNVLTALPLLFILPYLVGYKKLGGFIKSLFAFLAGIIVAIPCLILTPLKPIFLQTYIKRTFGNASHYDDTGVSFKTWIENGWLGAYSGGLLLGLVLLFVISWICYLGIKNYLKIRKVENSFILILLGLVLLLPVILFTERLWPHYLWTGHVFLLLGIAVLANQNLNLKYIFVLLYLLMTIGGIRSIVKQGKDLFFLESKAKELILNSKRAHAFIKKQRDTLVSIQDISVYYPFTEMLKINRYHPFSGKKPVKLEKEKFMWDNLMDYSMIKDEKTDYLLLNRFSFLDMDVDYSTTKDSIILKNKIKLREQYGKTIFLDTTFGSINVYRIESVK